MLHVQSCCFFLVIKSITFVTFLLLLLSSLLNVVTVWPGKPGTLEMFVECYFSPRKKPIRHEKTKLQARSVITVVCGFVASSRVLIFAVMGHNTINIPEIISSVHGFPSRTVTCSSPLSLLLWFWDSLSNRQHL